MKRYLNNMLCTAATMLLTCSCGNFLEEVSQDEFEPKTTSSFQELMNGQGYIMNSIDPITYMIDDDVQGCKCLRWTSSHTSRLELFQWQPDYWSIAEENADVLGNVQNSYQNLYKSIAVCNIIIELVPGSQGTDEQKAITMAEAKTMRAFYYLQLVNTYALPYTDTQTDPATNPGVPLITTSEVKAEGVARASVAEVYAQISADIDDACQLIGDDTTNRGFYRTAYTATHLLASRIYLYMGEWQKVVEHATLALNNAPALANLKTYTIDNQMSPTNGVISVKFPETIFIVGMKSMSGDYGLMGSPFGVSTEFASTYGIMDNRSKKYMAPSGFDYPYRIFKVCADEHEFTWRTAELYLNRAEAYMELYRKGDTAAGDKWAADLETLMDTRYLRHTAPTAGNIDEMQELMRSERRKELCYEGFRFFDLKRYGMPSIHHDVVAESGTVTRYVLQERDPFYCVPLPDEALDHNDMLRQNPLPSRRNPESL